MKRTLLLGACYLAVLGGTSIGRAADLPGVADLIIYNARVLTVNSNNTVASAVAVKDGKILAVGRDHRLEEYRGPETRMVDAQDRIVMPGLYDADVSSYVSATSELKTPVPDINSISDAQAYIRRQASNTPAGTWIVLEFIPPTRLKEGRMPTKDELDAATTNHPVCWNFGLNDVVNSKALEVSKIDADTPSPSRGEIVKEPRHRKPTGLLRNASSLLKLPKPDKPPTSAQERLALKRLYLRFNEQGITSIGEISTSPTAIDLFRDMARSNELTVRINCGRLFSPSRDADESLDRLSAFTNAAAGKLPYGPTGVGDDWVRIGPLQTMIDGSTGMGTAYLRTPYGIGPTYMNAELAYRGLLLQDSFALPQVYLAAAQQGWQLETHASGDAALDFVLNTYEQVQFKFDIKDKRFLIAHSEFQAAQDWKRCQNLGVGVILQPTSFYDNAANLEKTLGDKRLTYYMPFKSWFDRGIVTGGGSGHFQGIDSRTTPHAWNPWLNMWITLTRQTREGAPVNPEEKLTREQAVRLYTFNNAWLHGEDNVKGSLEPGKYADLVMLDTDILKCPLDEIPNTKVLLTLVNGKPVWQSVEPIFPGPQVIQSVTVNAPLQPVNVASPLTASQPASTSTPAAVATVPIAAAAAAGSASVNSQPAESATKHAAEATTSINPYAPVSDAPATPATPVSTPVGAAPVAVPVASTPAAASTSATASAPATISTSPAAPAATAAATTQTAPASQTASAPASSVTAPAPATTSTATAPAAPATVAPPVATAPVPKPAAQPATASSDAGFTSIAGAAPAEVGASQPTASAATTITNQAPSTVTNQAPGTISTNAAIAAPDATTTAAATFITPTQGATAVEAAQAAPAATGAAQVASASATWDKTSGATSSGAVTNSAAGRQDWSRVQGAK